MHARPTFAIRSTLISMLSAALAGCSGHVHSTLPPPPPPQPFVLFEVEPNGSFMWPHQIGPIAIGDWFEIVGHIDQLGPDLFDGFEFQSLQTCEVRFRLFADAPFTDLDVCLFDPYTGEKVAVWVSPYNPEVGSFSVFGGGVPFQLVVSSFVGDTTYALEMEVVPLGWPGDAPAGLALMPNSEPAGLGNGDKPFGVDWSGYEQLGTLPGSIDRALPFPLDLALRRAPLIGERQRASSPLGELR